MRSLLVLYITSTDIHTPVRFSIFSLAHLFIHTIGENRDQTVLNPVYLLDPAKLPLYDYFGKLLAISCRHSIMVPLSLPNNIWKPLVGELLKIEDLKSVDIHTVRSLGEIARGKVPTAQAVELLIQALLSSPLCSQSGVLAVHNAAAVRAVRSFISPPSSSSSSSISSYSERGGSHGGVGSSGGSQDMSGAEQGSIEESADVPYESPLSSSSSSRIRSICDLLLHTHLTAHAHGLEHFHRGIASVLPSEILPMFTAAELRTIFCGVPEVDLEVLKKATVYEGGVGPNDR